MDSNLKDESRNRRRDEALARRMGDALDQLAPQSAESCPDAELIASYYEKVLTPEDAAQCETHFAACSRCRKILAVLAASADTPLAEKDVARLGQLAGTAHVPNSPLPQKAAVIHSARFDWRTRWLAPALGVAAALAVWFAVRPPWRTLNQGSPNQDSGSLVAQANKNESVPPLQATPKDPVLQVPPAKKETDALGSSATPPVRSVPPAPREPQASANLDLSKDQNTEAFASNGSSAKSAPQTNEKTREGLNSSAASGAISAAPAAALLRAPAAQAPPNADQSAANQVAQAAAPEARATNRAATAARESPLATTETADASAARDKQAGAQQKALTDLPLNGRRFSALALVQAPPIQIRAPSGQVLWRADKNGRIERSANAGSSWTSQTSPSNEDWLAGMAVSGSICWLAGRNGAIARTTDGEHWEKISPPPLPTNAPGKLPDWTSVTATGAQTATVASADGRRFTTQDGGKTWQAQ